MAGVGGKDPYPYFQWFDPRESAFPPPAAGIFDEPNRRICINAQWVKWIAGVIHRLEYADVYEGTETEIEEAIQEILKLQFALGGAGNSCQEYTPPVIEPPPAPSGFNLPDCIELLDTDGDGIIDLIEIDQREGDCMVVNIYQNGGCGCGNCGCGGSSGGGSSASGGGNSDFNDIGTGGGGVGDVGGARGVTKCDVASYMLPYVISQGKEFFDEMNNYLNTGADISDFFEEASGFFDASDITPVLVSGFKSVVDNLNGNVEQIIDVLEDTDFLSEFQESWWRATSDDGALTGKISNLTRADLRRGNRHIPLTWGSVVDGAIVLPRVVLDLFFSIINMPKVNRRLTLAEGQANATLCEYLAAQIGDTYTPPVSPGSVAPPDFTGLLSFTGDSVTYDIEIYTINQAATSISSGAAQVTDGDAREIVGAAVLSINIISDGTAWYRPYIRAQNSNFYRTDTDVPLSASEYRQIVFKPSITQQTQDGIKERIRTSLDFAAWDDDTTIAFNDLVVNDGNSILVGNSGNLPANTSADIEYVVLVKVAE